MSYSKHILSKSSFLSGLQCHKKLYFEKFRRDLKPPVSEVQQAIFNTGHNVGELAQKLFPNGKDASPENFNYQKAVENTRSLIDEGCPIIYEASFQFNGVLVIMDILVDTEEGWKAYEVKSSTEVKPVNKNDAAIQYYVITHSGLALSDISIVHINNEYIRQGNLDINALFTISSVKEDVLNLQEEIPQQITLFSNIATTKEEPSVDIGPHCTKPYDCDFRHHCWSHVPEDSVFDISRIGKNAWELYDMGVLDIKDIPDSFDLNHNQRMQVRHARTGATYINKEEIQHFVNNLKFPLIFLDFETYQMAVPPFDNIRPYRQIVFQYSLHTQTSLKIEYNHHEYLSISDGSDPRKKLLEDLIANCGTEGDILAFNMGFEKMVLNELLEVFPHYEDQIQSIISRMKDLMIPFRDRRYYMPEMKGSYSIKAILPALVPELSYYNLEIQEGGTASRTFAQMNHGDYTGSIEETRKNLLEYCKLDTWAMVKILEKLQSVME
jgi:hypothetical protein